MTESIIIDYHIEVQKLHSNHTLSVQDIHNEYVLALQRAGCNYSLQITLLNDKLRDLLKSPSLLQKEQQIQKKESVVIQQEMTSEEYVQAVDRINNRSTEPSTYQKTNAPGIKELSTNTESIAQKVMQTTPEEDERSQEHRKELQRLSLLIEGEEYERAVEKLNKENKKIWIYRVNSSININPPVDEDPHNVIVNVIDNDFDFSEFKPSNTCIISAVVGVGFLGGL